MATTNGTGEPSPDGVYSLLDTDLYKLTMQCAVHKYFPGVVVKYNFTNRTPDMLFNREAFDWLRNQVAKLGHLTVSAQEIEFLKTACPYLPANFLEFLGTFKLHPEAHVKLAFQLVQGENTRSGTEQGTVSISVEGRWVDTILYEIPLLALVSEAYFKFCDKDWDHGGQVDKAYQKGIRLLEHGCAFSEFGSRRRRDYKTHDMVMQGLRKANEESTTKGYPGKWSGTSNVHFAMKYGVAPIGTVAHEWFMGIAAITNDYKTANEKALQYWTGTFGRGTLSIALTDTFGTPDFLKAFEKPAPPNYSIDPHGSEPPPNPTYAKIFTGTRQDSGDPFEFIKTMRRFYDSQGITESKTIVFSDSLNVDRCIEYMNATKAVGLTPSFGVGTFFTNDFVRKSTGVKSVPLNIVIKISEAEGRHAVKISDNIGKNTGDSELVARVKKELGYTEKSWEGGDEKTRWGKETAVNGQNA